MPFNKIPGPTVGADLSRLSPIYRPSGKSTTSPHQFVKQHYRAPGAAFNSRYLGQIVIVVGAGEVRSGEGTLASPMVGRGIGRCSFHKIPTLEGPGAEGHYTRRF
ncbi:MAG: hypothetical protein E6I80_19120 [Chloroflexi bacterium]|nr:MAG: hypothetical protein E6I80_19120 [Chloroflexota bacterium]